LLHKKWFFIGKKLHFFRAGPFGDADLLRKSEFSVRKNCIKRASLFANALEFAHKRAGFRTICASCCEKLDKNEQKLNKMM